MRTGFFAGVAYFLVMLPISIIPWSFASLFVEPNLGQDAASFARWSLTLIAGLIVSRWLVAIASPELNLRARWIMGSTAVVLLIFADGSIAVVHHGATIAGYIDSYRSIGGVTKLLGQIGLAILPAVMGRHSVLGRA